jgi:hypothetical protein
VVVVSIGEIQMQCEQKIQMQCEQKIQMQCEQKIQMITASSGVYVP